MNLRREAASLAFIVAMSISFVASALTKTETLTESYSQGQGCPPQGGPLSPLLSNIVLKELDKELERCGPITWSSASSRKTPDVRLPDGGNPVDAMAEK